MFNSIFLHIPEASVPETLETSGAWWTSMAGCRAWWPGGAGSRPPAPAGRSGRWAWAVGGNMFQPELGLNKMLLTS